MRKIAILWMFLTAILTGCHPKGAKKDPLVTQIDSEELSRIIVNFSTKMKIDKHLELEDSWAAYEDYILKICLKYSSQRLLTVYDARLLMVEVVDELLYRLNNNSIISFELKHYPFTAEDIEVKIDFESFYGRYIDQQYVGSAWLKAGCLHFYAFDHKDASLNGIDWESHRCEPYTKSRELALIKKQADLPYVEEIENPNPPKKAQEGRFIERYIPGMTY